MQIDLPVERENSTRIVFEVDVYAEPFVLGRFSGPSEGGYIEVEGVDGEGVVDWEQVGEKITVTFDDKSTASFTTDDLTYCMMEDF